MADYKLTGDKRYGLTREADTAAVLARAGYGVQNLDDDYQVAKLSEVVPLSKRVDIFTPHFSGLSQTDYLKLVQKVSQRMLNAAQEAYPKLSPGDRIIVTGFKTQLIPLPGIQDAEILAGGSIVKYSR